MSIHGAGMRLARGEPDRTPGQQGQAGIEPAEAAPVSAIACEARPGGYRESAAQQAAQVSVIVAARNAAHTIERALLSALAQPETLEVIVVNDASSDETGRIVEALGRTDPRIRLIELARNVGPGGARNIALGAARGTFVTILDADDFLLPGRLGSLAAQMGDADIIADDLCLSDAATPLQIDGRLVGQAEPERLSLARFVQGNAVRPGQRPRELGFLKPLMRRAFLERHGLRYIDDLRLGEDFVLYAAALAQGAKFILMPARGYVAVRYGQSLSWNHRTEDLRAYLAACTDLAATGKLGPAERRAFRAHLLGLRRRLGHRELLDAKREKGMGGVIEWIGRNADLAPAVAWRIFKDKLRR